MEISEWRECIRFTSKQSTMMMNKVLLPRFFIVAFLFQSSSVSIVDGRRRADSEPSLPSHLPSPEGGKASPEGSSVPGNSNPADSLFTRIPPLPAPPSPSGDALPHEGAFHSGPNVPLGLEKLILILVPQFKMKIRHTPKWWGANVKMSLPITVFFDKLSVPPNSPPMYFFPFGPLLPATHNQRVIRSASLRKEKKLSVLSLPPPGTIKGGERAVLIPRAESMLKSFGMDGRACLLRAVCEVHETPLDHYGFLGEVLKLLFSVSNSAYALSHLPRYHNAELMGKSGNCSSYIRNCPESLFHNEEKNDRKEEEENFYS